MVCGLAYLKYSKISMRKAVKKYPNFVDFDNELNAKLCYSYKKGSETKYGLIVFKEGKNDANRKESNLSISNFFFNKFI